MATRFRIKDHWAEQRMFLQRAIAAGIAILALLAILIIRLVHLQVVRNEYYMELSQGNRLHLEPVPPNRGLILDRLGTTVLAENRPAYQLELTAEQLPMTSQQKPDIDGALAGLVALGLVEQNDIPRLKRVIHSHRTFEGVALRVQMTDKEVARFAVHRHEFPGVDIKTRLTRHYPLGAIAVHALGYVSTISEQDLAKIDAGQYFGTSLIGKVGLEASFEKDLHGSPGYREILVNAQGRPVGRESLLQKGLSSKTAVAGKDLLLSLDINTQRIAEEALGERRGAVVALDPTNGDVLAFVSKPGFDPNLFSRGITQAEYGALNDSLDRPLFNRAIRGMYPSGSTIKPVIGLAGLTNRVMSAGKLEYCAGTFRLPNSRLVFREGKTGKHGYMDLPHAIAKSCDVYFYDLAATLGVTRITNFMAPFGYGQLTGIDIVGEKAGLLPTPNWKKSYFKRPQDQVWFPGETVNLGLGQGYLLVTPMQLAHVAALLASRGKTYRPRLVTGVRDPSGAIRTIAPIPNAPLKGISDKDWDAVLQGMVGATTYGTASTVFKKSSYTAAGKTGTAQVFTVARTETLTDKVADRLKDHAWFIAFAPVEAPRIALVVLVENGGFGAAAAAPIARKVMDAWILGDQAPDALAAKDKSPDAGAKDDASPAAKTPAPAQQKAARSGNDNTPPVEAEATE